MIRSEVDNSLPTVPGRCSASGSEGRQRWRAVLEESELGLCCTRGMCDSPGHNLCVTHVDTVRV